MPNNAILIRPNRADDIEILQQIRSLAFKRVFRSLRRLLSDEIADVVLATAEAEQAKLLAHPVTHYVAELLEPFGCASWCPTKS